MSKIILFFKKYFYFVCLIVISVFIVLYGVSIYKHTQGNVLINEVCSSNVACCMDEYGQYPDWIEVYNPTQDYTDISGFVLNKSTDLNKEKYIVPDGTVLAPGSFFLFDPGFRIGSEGCTVNLLDSENHYIDRVNLPKLKYDTTYSRLTDGSFEWEIKEPTPGYSNNEGRVLDPVIDGEVLASETPGFYDAEFELRLSSSNWGRDIYYTLDGSDPIANGTLYNAPILIRDRTDEKNIYSAIPEVSPYYVDKETELPTFPVDKCTVVKAVAKDRLGRYTDICSYTYFVGFNKRKAYDNMAVVSISVNPDDFFSYEDGIYVLGKYYDDFVQAGEPEDYDPNRKANFSREGRESERPISFEIYDENHMMTLKTEAGVRVKGMGSRWDVQKSFSVIFRPAYGGNYKESFTLQGKDYQLHSLAIDKCGQETGTKMVDTIMNVAMSDTKCVTTDRIPASLFLNGEYWGFYWLTERMDNTFFADKYGVNEDDVIIKNKEDFVSEDEWNEYNFDRESLLDYYAANIITAHCGDWPDNNVRFWKTGTDEGTEFGDGKLRPVIFDMNSRSMEDVDDPIFDTLTESYYPFMKLLSDDESFRVDIVNRINYMCSHEFEQQKILKHIDDIYYIIRDQMVLDKMRYSNLTEKEALDSFNESVEMLRDFYRNRYDYLKVYEDEFLNAQ
ncbi:MAG: CotH kinase family protein [Lachnospiraceae bacterium]|nr:CotH kinase family protein [Lachnospiraceae bacterium]